MRELDAADVAAAHDLVTRALPAEGLSEDELRTLCFDEPEGFVLGTDDGEGVVAGVTRRVLDLTVGYVRLVAVDPDHRRRGLGRALLAAAEDRLFAAGAQALHLGGEAPFYLWPGVDATAVGMACLAEAAGYDPTGADVNMAVPATFRAPVPDGVALRRVLGDDDAAAVAAFVAAHWPHWVPELDRGIDQGGAFGAFVDGTPVGFACHSVNRLGWVGPMGTDPDRRSAGLGHALLAALCTDVMVAGLADAEVSWVGPVRFYAKAGGRVSRVFRGYRKPRP